ncbi:signal peptidase I [Streptomyces sp. NPDC051561]|uniref:signal peptidase I n=1 Tax=Streptomyces sp. NPDC051561 TaxID=3365658 RepID=UPI0037A463A3
MAVGARSGHDGSEDEPERRRRTEASPAGATDAAPADSATGSTAPRGAAPTGAAPAGPAPGGPAPAGTATGQTNGESVSDTHNGPPDGSGHSGGNGRGGDGDGAHDDEAPRAERKQRSFWKELPLLIGIALLLALLIKTFLVQAFSIPSESMQETLQRGDRVLVDKLTPWFGAEPERGEVVVFHDPGGWLNDTAVAEPNAVQKVLSFIGLMPSAEDKDLIKRVIAVGGDTVECKAGGSVHVNGHALDDKSYISPQGSPCDDKPFGPLKVPANKLWVMGDNRKNSLDSRYHQEIAGGGMVDTEEVVGRAVVVAWPISRWSTLPVPDTFDQPGLASATAAAASVAPGALGVAGAIPLVLWRRRRLTSGRTDG